MRFEVWAFLKYGFCTLVFLGLTDCMHIWYERYRKRIRSREINEAAFIMSNSLPCCRHNEKIEIVNKCQNPHCKAKLSQKIVNHINSAKHLICVAMYMLTVHNIADALMRAKDRGVKVRIITNHSMIETSGSQINKLQLGGLAVRIAGDDARFMHNKFCLIDVLIDENEFDLNTHPVNGILINGSLNWTTNAFDRNWENVYFTSDEHLKSEFKRAFDYIWRRLSDTNNLIIENSHLRE